MTQHLVIKVWPHLVWYLYKTNLLVEQNNSNLVDLFFQKRPSSYGSNEGGVVNGIWSALMGLFQFILMILVSIKNGFLGLFQGSSTPPPSSQDRVNTPYQNRLISQHVLK